MRFSLNFAHCNRFARHEYCSSEYLRAIHSPLPPDSSRDAYCASHDRSKRQRCTSTSSPSKVVQRTHCMHILRCKIEILTMTTSEIQADFIRKFGQRKLRIHIQLKRETFKHCRKGSKWRSRRSIHSQTILTISTKIYLIVRLRRIVNT